MEICTLGSLILETQLYEEAFYVPVIENHTFGFPGIWSKLKYQYPIPSSLHTVTKGLHVLYLYVSISLETTYNKISSVFICLDLSCAGPLEKLSNAILNTELLIFYVDFSCQINLTSLTSSDILS